MRLMVRVIALVTKINRNNSENIQQITSAEAW